MQILLHKQRNTIVCFVFFLGGYGTQRQAHRETVERERGKERKRMRQAGTQRQILERRGGGERKKADRHAQTERQDT